jgi:hypothetical protein
LADYEAHGGLKGLRNAIAMTHQPTLSMKLLNQDFGAVVALASQLESSGTPF